MSERWRPSSPIAEAPGQWGSAWTYTYPAQARIDALRRLLGGGPTSPAFDASSTSARRRQSQAGDGFVLHLGRRVATWFGLAKGGA